MTIKKIKYHRVYEDVIEQIEQIIFEGNLAPGDLLPTERELAQQFGISRGTLREAFRILEREGLIETRPGGGRFVSEQVHSSRDRSRLMDNIERATIMELLEARELFEVGIVELAALKATESDLLEIRHALEAWGKTEGDSDEPVDSDQAFHLALAKATHNIVLISMTELHMGLLQKTKNKTISLPNRGGEIYEEHLAIYEAIQSRDPGKAKEALLAHLRKVKQYIQADRTFAKS